MPTLAKRPVNGGTAKQRIYNILTSVYVVAMNSRPLNIAIIGSGMAGLTAAYVLKQHGHHISLYESQAKSGLDAHSTAFAGGMIDAPLRVMNPQLWSHTLALAAHVGIDLYRVRTDMACSWMDGNALGKTWFSTRRQAGLGFPVLGSWRHAQKIPALALGLYQLKQALKHMAETDTALSLSEWLQAHAIHPLFWHGCVVPVLLTVCTCDVATLMRWPARPLLVFVDLLLRDAGLYRLQGGTQALANALKQGVDLLNHTTVSAIHQNHEQIFVRDAAEHTRTFDHVIVATPTQACGFLDEQQFAQEKQALQQLPYSSGELISHTDDSVMPHQRRDWSPLHYSMRRDFSAHSFSVWLNPIEESLRQQPQAVFQTWNSLSPISDAAIVQHTYLTRAVCTPESLLTVKRLQRLQAGAPAGQRRLWLCGSWSCDGLPVLESAVTSALTVCQHLGASLPLQAAPILP